MKVHPIDFLAVLSQVAGLGILASDANFQSSITTLAGPYGPKIVAGLGLAALLASTVLRVYGCPTTASGGSTPSVPPAAGS